MNGKAREKNSSNKEHSEIEKSIFEITKKFMRDIDTESRRKFEAYR